MKLIDKNRAISAIKMVERINEFFTHVNNAGYVPDADLFRKLRSPRCKNFFLQFSRSWGKSTMLGMDMVFEAGTIPNSKCYIIAPTRVQAYEIYWASSFLKRIIPPDWLVKGEEGVSKSELRWWFKNGSFIKLDGADNEDALRGYKPTRLGKDEAQAWKKEASDAMEPNLLAHDAAVIEIGTPPDILNHFIVRGDYVNKRYKMGDPRYYYARKDIYTCPRYPRERIDALRMAHIERGEEAVWRREYLAEFVPGGAFSLLPQFDHTRHAKPLDWILEQLKLGGSKVDYYTISDPSGTRHASLFFAHCRASSRLFLLKEVVETESLKLSAGQLAPRLRAMESLRLSGEVFRIYDEAAKLYAIEMAQHGLYFAPTKKKQNDKSNNISLFRDLLMKDLFFVNEDCKQTIDDIYQYHTDDRGKIVKVKDDCVDCFHGDTLVDTLRGQARIKDLVGGVGEVYSCNGLTRPFKHVRKTYSNVPVFKVTFSDGRSVTATCHHKLLLADNTWKRIDCLRPLELIQCSTEAQEAYGKSRRIEREKAAIPWSELLPYRQILYAHKAVWQRTQRFASSCLGALQWPDLREYAYSSQGQQPWQQPNRELGITTTICTFTITCSGAREESLVEKKYNRNGCSSSESLAQERIGEGLAQASREGLRSEAERPWQVSGDVHFLWRDVFDLELQADQDLQPELLAEILSKNKAKKVTYACLRVMRQAFSSACHLGAKTKTVLFALLLRKVRQSKTTRVVKIEKAGLADTYCMEVEDTHCLSVNGGVLAHNCCLYCIAETGYDYNHAGVNLEPSSRRFYTPYEDSRMPDEALFIPKPTDRLDDVDFEEEGIWDLMH